MIVFAALSLFGFPLGFALVEIRFGLRIPDNALKLLLFFGVFFLST
jgi:hypothetical protein